MGDVYELEAKSGRIWLNAAKKQVDQSTRIVGKEPVSDRTKFTGELQIFWPMIFLCFNILMNNLRRKCAIF